MTLLPAITLWDPWASLVAAGAPPCEVRKWPAPPRLWGKRIAIHAGARPIRRAEVNDLLVSLRLEGGWGTALHAEQAIEILQRIQADPKRVPLSHVLCTARLGKPVPANEIELERLATNGFIGDSARIDHQMFGWPLTDIEPLIPPVPARGAQGFWNWQVEGYGA